MADLTASITSSMSDIMAASISVSEAPRKVVEANEEGVILGEILAEKEEVREISKRDNIICCFVFVILGNASLYYWNALLNCVYDVIAQQYPDEEGMSDILTAVFNTLCFATTVVVLIFGGALHQWMMYTGLAGLGICSLLFCFIVQYLDGQAGYASLITLQVVAGITTGFVEGGAFAFACILPKIYAGWVSFGMGVSGIFSFCVYMLFSECVFQGNVAGNVWVNLGVSTAFSLVGIVGCWWLFKWDVAAHSIERVQEQLANSKNLPKDEQPMGWWHVFKATWGTQVNTCYTMWLTLLLFPNVGPLAWNDNSSKTNTVMGMFQVGDFTGRYIPNMVACLPFVMLPKTVLYILSACRLLFIPFFVFCKIWTDSPWNSFGVHIVLMLCLAISSGWYVTLSLIYNPQTLERQIDRNRASAIGTCLLLFGISAGLWMAKLFSLF